MTVTISVAFGCPFEGKVGPGLVAELAGTRMPPLEGMFGRRLEGRVYRAGAWAG